LTRRPHVDITLHAVAIRAIDLHLSGDQGALRDRRGRRPHVVDLGDELEYRDSTAQDLYDAARLAENLENIHFFQRTMVCRDVSRTIVEMDLNTLYGCNRRNDEACRHFV
jgi:trimethylamine--corrinoid protein Co-methyltransferase